MNKGFMALALALMAGCIPADESGFLNPVPTESEQPSVIVESFEINSVYETFVVETGCTYFTVYAVNLDTRRTECIADDISAEYARENEWLITIGQRVTRVYESGQPFYTGELSPME